MKSMETVSKEGNAEQGGGETELDLSNQQKSGCLQDTI